MNNTENNNQIDNIINKINVDSTTDTSNFTENYILNNLDNINNLCYVVINNRYDENFMEKVIDHLDTQELVRRNYLSDIFLEKYVYPYMDDREAPSINIYNYVNKQREKLINMKKLNQDERNIELKKLNKIHQSLIDFVMND